MDIQKLHDWAKVGKEKAAESARLYKLNNNLEYARIKGSDAFAFSLIIDGAELLLKSAHGSNHKDIAHCANTTLGECAASAETGTGEEPAGNSLSETAIVRQNEVAKEVCDRCGTEMYQKGIYVKCPSCDHW